MSLGQGPLAQAQILHLELGAANYSSEYGQAEERFAVLEYRMEKLIARYGASGTIYLNDVNGEGLQEAVAHSQQWLSDHGYNEIKVIPIEGNYERRAIFEDLPKVTTATLANPQHEQLPSGTSPVSIGFNRRVTLGLLHLAAQSATGLEIHTHFHHNRNNFIGRLAEFIQERKVRSRAEDMELGNPDLFQLIALPEKPPAYLLPNGYRSSQSEVLAYRLVTDVNSQVLESEAKECQSSLGSEH